MHALGEAVGQRATLARVGQLAEQVQAWGGTVAKKADSFKVDQLCKEHRHLCEDIIPACGTEDRARVPPILQIFQLCLTKIYIRLLYLNTHQIVRLKKNQIFLSYQSKLRNFFITGISDGHTRFSPSPIILSIVLISLTKRSKP